MLYGNDKTIHGTQYLHVEVDDYGKVVSVWFRCCALPFRQVNVDTDRAVEMEQMYQNNVNDLKLNAVDIETKAKE